MKRSLRSWLWRVPIRQEVDEEIAFHIEMRIRELVERGGMDPATARTEAIRRLGNVAHLKRTCVDLGRKRERRMRVGLWLEELRDDLKFAARQLRKDPAFSIVAVCTLALGIGANSAIFALVDATLLRPLPVPNADRLVMVWESTPTSPRTFAASVNVVDWNERSRSFERIAGFAPGVGGVVMAGKDGTAETIPRQWVSAGFFDVLGVVPVAGRTFHPSDEAQRANLVVLNEAFWRSRFNADPDLIGRDIRLDGTLYTVVGVVPTDFQLFGRTSIWAFRPMLGRSVVKGAYGLQAIGRLRPGVTIDSAQSDISAVAERLAQEFPTTNKGRGVVLQPAHDALIGGELRSTAMLFLGVAGFVLLMCCANVASLLLARATVRARELAVRSALGAGRTRVIRQLLTENLVLAAIGGVAGLALGAVILRIAPSVMPQGLLPSAVTLAFDVRVVTFCIGAALVVALLLGIAPAWQATRLSAAQVLAAENRSVIGRGGRLRSLLVVGEVAIAVLLLFGGGLLLRTLLAIERVDRGYRAQQVLTMLVDPLDSDYPTAASLLQFLDAVKEEVKAVPRVGGVAWTSAVPLGRSYDYETLFEVVGDPPIDENRRPRAGYQIVSPDYFEVLDLPIVAGRGFGASDVDTGMPVCIVSEAFVRHNLQGRSVIGTQLALRDAPRAQPVIREIVGVARQVKGRLDEAEERQQVYVPMPQDPTGDMFLAVRPSTGSAASLAPSVRAAVARIDKKQLVSVRDVMTLEDVEWEATGRHRFRAVLVLTFAALALLLAMVGVFGILSYSVQQRVRDFGVRRALGATTADLQRLVMTSGVRLVGAGVLIGIVFAAAVGRMFSTMLFGVRPLDPMTFVAVALVLAVTAASSIAGPAFRASRIDPAAALRSE